MTNAKKISSAKPQKWLCFLALLLCACVQLPDYCSDYNPYNPSSQFCFAGKAVNKCGGKIYDPSSHCCDASGTVSEKCGNGGEDTPHTHTWGGWIVMERASCETQGLEINTCQTDNSHVLEQAIPQLSGTACEPTHTHSFGEWQTTAQPTCTMLGQQMRSCGCGYSEIQQIPTDQSAHMWNNWITTTPATCSAAGQETIICMLNATHTNTRALPQLTGDDSHTYGGWIVTTNATCSATGVETRTCTQNTNHIDRRETPKLTGTACEPTHTHSFGDWHTTAQATCSAPGQEKKSCSCGADEVRETAQLTGSGSHSWGSWEVATPATCNAPGETKRTCTLNSAHFETSPIPQTNTHSYGGWTTAKPATCSAPGELTRTCTINSAHTETQPIAQLAHVWSDYTVTTPATCSAPGVETRTCTASNTPHSETRAIAQLSGTQCVTGCTQWGDWTQTSPATCTGPGLQTRTCIAGSSDTETRNLPAQLTGSSCVTGNTFTDSRDGKVYRMVTIGTQTWMAQNLNYDVPSNTTDVCYSNNSSNCDLYGRMYNWTTVMNGASSSLANPSGVQGVCPAGWHVPSDAEWTVLTDAVGGSSTAGTKLKSTTGWSSGGNGTDNHGFSALPGGIGYGGSFYDAGDYGFWWSATENAASNAWGQRMSYYDNVYRDYIGKTYLYSVRCVRD